MSGLLIVTAAGPEDPTRATIPFHIAVNGARPSGTEVAVALAGDAAELIKPDVTANDLGLGVPPLRGLLDKCIDQNVPGHDLKGLADARGVFPGSLTPNARYISLPD